MDYLFLKLWPYLACAFALGVVWGFYTTSGIWPRKDS